MRVLAGLALVALATPAFALEAPVAGQKDDRMRYVAYDPNQVVQLTTAVGTTMVVTFRAEETVTAVAVTNSKDLSAMPRGNFLFLKSKSPLPAQPLVVLTKGEDGARRYVFEITTPATLATEVSTANQPNLYYSVQFTYPADEAAARRKVEKEKADAARAALETRRVAWESRRTRQALESEARVSFSGNRNWRYVAQGSRTILPLEVFDNGFSTVFRFPGNVRIPSIFVVNPDGHEATANYSVKGDLVQVDTVARSWRLRDGQTVLGIWNQAFDAVGNRPTTGTTSSGVTRQLRAAAP